MWLLLGLVTVQVVSMFNGCGYSFKYSIVQVVNELRVSEGGAMYGCLPPGIEDSKYQILVVQSSSCSLCLVILFKPYKGSYRAVPYLA